MVARYNSKTRRINGLRSGNRKRNQDSSSKTVEEENKSKFSRKKACPLYLLSDTFDLSHPVQHRTKQAYEPMMPKRSTRTQLDGDPPTKSHSLRQRRGM